MTPRPEYAPAPPYEPIKMAKYFHDIYRKRHPDRIKKYNATRNNKNRIKKAFAKQIISCGYLVNEV